MSVLYDLTMPNLLEARTLQGILGLPAPVPGAAFQGLELRFQILDEGGVGAFVEALHFVGVILQVVELLFPSVILDVLLGLSPNPLEGELPEFLQQYSRTPWEILAAQERH